MSVTGGPGSVFVFVHRHTHTHMATGHQTVLRHAAYLAPSLLEPTHLFSGTALRDLFGGNLSRRKGWAPACPRPASTIRGRRCAGTPA